MTDLTDERDAAADKNFFMVDRAAYQAYNNKLAADLAANARPGGHLANHCPSV